MANSTQSFAHVDAARLHGMLDELAAFGRTPGGGVSRLAASPEDGAARDYFRAWLKGEGFKVLTDRVGNIYGVLDLAGPDAPLILTGSHLDSQPSGGRFDGAYGVVASSLAATSIRAFASARPVAFSSNLGVVAWTNEEGARYEPSTMGSAVFAGGLAPEAALARTDAKGVTLEQALDEIGYLGKDAPPRRVASYVEIHIEQGSMLESANRTIGVVESNWGTMKYIADIEGKASHTGPTPMAERRDALLAAARIILFCRALSDETGGKLLASVGRLDIHPNSTNVVAGRVRLFAEFRAIDPLILAAACKRFEEEAAANSCVGVSVEVTPTTAREAGEFDAGLRDLIEEVAVELGHPTMRLHTIAGHDAVPLRSVCRTGMIFVPSVEGLSHHEAEFTRPEHLEAGAAVLTTVLFRLATGRA